MHRLRRHAATLVLLFMTAILVAVAGIVPQIASAADVPPAQTLIFSTLQNFASTLVIVPLASPTRTPSPVAIGNFVWDDLDQDGRQDAGEPGLANVTVQLWNTAKTQLLASTVTNATGNYTVIAPLPGSYRIRVVLPSVLDQFSPKNQANGDDLIDSDINPSGSSIGFTDTFILASNVISTSIYDAGIIRFRTPTPTRTPTPINIGNFVWDDLDQDGRQDAGEPGLANVTVQLWNTAKTQLLASTVTNATGSYSLVTPLPGSFRIRVVLPAFLDQFSPKDQAAGDDQLDSDINTSGANLGFTDVFVLASNVISTTIYDAGIIRFRTPTPTRTQTPINIGNFVWDDLDQDGRQDAGEPGLANVTVQLWNTAKTQLLASTVTNASGSYSLVTLLPGSYRIRVVLPGVLDQFSSKNQAAGDDQLDSDINPSGSNLGFTDSFVLASNVISTTIYDAGIIRFRTPTPTRTPTPINIGNFVWDDLDADGRQDAGEPGLPNVTVQLWNSAKTQLIYSTVTSATGSYSVIAQLPGNYRIRVVLPSASYYFSPKDLAGGNDQQDSDINPAGTNIGFSDVFNLASNVISTTIHDAGIVTPLTIQALPSALFIPLATGTPVLAAPPLPSPTNASLINPQPLPPPTATPYLPPPVSVCQPFRLTSPLDGLPNGEATFYWDPVSPGAATYQIRVFDEAHTLLATFPAGNATTVIGDVSVGSIGGGFVLIVQVNALSNGTIICTDEHQILRAALDLSVPPTPRPTRRGN